MPTVGKETNMEQVDIGAIDINLKVEIGDGGRELIFRDVRQKPFQVYGLYDPCGQEVFRRLPTSVAEQCNPGVLKLHTNTAGGRVRFATDSPYIAIRAVYRSVCHMTHMAMCGSCGFDLYRDDEDSAYSTFVGVFKPPKEPDGGYTSCINVGDRGMAYYTINFPLYNNVDSLYIGVAPNAKIAEGKPYRAGGPVVYFGSSITQGGCASRPGNAFPAIVGRRMNMDHVNLGFSGSGRAEPAMREFIASMEMSAFVSDYDHNAPDVKWLSDTHYPLYAAVREKHPDIPIIFMSRPDIKPESNRNFAFADCRRVILSTYDRAQAAGDKNVYYIDGFSLFCRADRDLCTVDGSHPGDYGFFKMAEPVEQMLQVAFHDSWYKI